jgi:phosphatidate cytidylyltransferase
MNNFFLRLKTSCLLFVICLSFLLLPPLFLSLFFITLLCFAFFSEWLPLCKKNFYFILLSPFYPILPFLLLSLLCLETYGISLVYITLIITASFDTGSYIIGNMYGKTPLCPTISPRKTIEGVYGGIVALLMVAFLIGYFYQITHYIFFLLHLFLIGFFGFLGDLFESWIKRTSLVKDSGSILPGHGGLLDRFDSLLGAIFYVYLAKKSMILVLFS